MDKVLDYLSANPQYVTALIVTAAALIVLCVLGFFIKKYNLLRFLDKFSKKTPEAEQKNAEQTAKKDDTPPTTKTVSDEIHVVVVNNEQEMQDELDGGADAYEAELDDVQYTDQEPAVKTEKSSRFSSMVKASMQNFAAEDYEEDKKYVQQTKSPQKFDTPTKDDVHHEGTWRIMREGSTFVAYLETDDKRTLIKTENYSAMSGVKSAINSLKKTVKSNNFTIAINAEGKFYFKLFTPSNRLVCTSEAVDTREHCKEIIEQTKRLAEIAEIVRG